MTEVKPREKGKIVRKKLLCPLGHEGPHRYVETVQCWRQVNDLDFPAKGQKRPIVLAIDGRSESGEGYDDGEDGHLECHADLEPGPGLCLVEFDLPDGVEIDWV